MFSTPDYNADYEKVYEPSEDTFVILDTLEQEYNNLKDYYKEEVPICLEIGSGTGLITTFLQKNILGEQGGIYLTTDLNLFANLTTLNTNLLNNKPRKTPIIDTIQCDLASAILPNKVDLLIFNPPYVPSEKVPERKEIIDIALCGGKDGMEVTSRVLNDLPKILSADGIALILFCARNNPKEICKTFEDENLGWKVIELFHRKAGWEELSVWKFFRSDD